jgi:hypothetical protein
MYEYKKFIIKNDETKVFKFDSLSGVELVNLIRYAITKGCLPLNRFGFFISTGEQIKRQENGWEQNYC